MAEGAGGVKVERIGSTSHRWATKFSTGWCLYDVKLGLVHTNASTPAARKWVGQ